MASPHIGLIVTGLHALLDYTVFCRTLEVWHPDATLYVFTDSETPVHTVTFKGTVHVKVALDAYKGLTRRAMEGRPGILYDSLFKDYTYEKANVLDWMWSMSPAHTLEGAWFLDADICFLAPLPAIPATTTLALSPHSIRPADERLYGKYNAGFLWFKDRTYLDAWRAAARTSRFFEQAALEDLATLANATSSLYEFPIQVNFGWWRMFQSTEPPAAIAAKFSLFRAEQSVGIRYDGKALQSVHTHWYQMDGSATDSFNRFLKSIVARFPTHRPLAQFGKAI